MHIVKKRIRRIPRVTTKNFPLHYLYCKKDSGQTKRTYFRTDCCFLLRSAHIEEVSGFSKGSAVSKENYTLNGEEAGKDVDDNIPGIQETESETETQTQEAAVSDNGDGSVYDDNFYDQEQYNDYSPDGYNYDEEY